MSAKALCWWLAMAFCADGVLVAAGSGSLWGLVGMSWAALAAAGGYEVQRHLDQPQR